MVPIVPVQNGPLSTMAPEEGHSRLWEGRVPDLASWMGLAVRARVRTCLSKLAPKLAPCPVGPEAWHSGSCLSMMEEPLPATRSVTSESPLKLFDRTGLAIQVKHGMAVRAHWSEVSLGVDESLSP